MSLTKTIAEIFSLLRRRDFKTLKNKVFKRRNAVRLQKKYALWLKKNGDLSASEREKVLTKIKKFSFHPKISIVLPVYNVEEIWLRKCLNSVLDQIYQNWELCIADDYSPSPHIRQILEEFAAKDERIKVISRTQNGHISAASNSAFELASGEFCALLDHDDELSKDALFYVVKELNDFPETSFIYSDEDMIDAEGKRYEPKFKPDFARELFYSVNYLTHLAIYRTEILRKIGGWREGLEGSQDYDLALRVIEEIPEHQIRHIPRILYHWRAIQGSVALSADEKPYAHECAREAIRAHLERTGKNAKVVQTIWNFHRVRYDLPENPPKTSVIFYGGEPKNTETDYKNLEIITTAEDAAEGLNAAAKKATGEVLIFVDANLESVSLDWIEELTSFAIQKEIGVVGAKILSRDETVLHGGLIVGTDEIVSAAHKNFFRTESGNLVRNQVTGNYSAVSIACFAVRRELFEEVGGFDAENLPDRFFDADFCLKLREKNYQIVFTPYVELMKIDDKKPLNCERKPAQSEEKYFTEKWHETIERDPFYNPNLSKKDASFVIKI